MNFLDIPVEVIEGHLLPYLRWNDLLRFRRVSKATKDIADCYLQVHAKQAPEIEINEDGKGFDEYLEMNIPTTRIFLNNVSGEEFYQQDWRGISNFLKNCGPMVKHLRVKQLSLYCCGKELDFIDALKNLESFEADHFGILKNNTTSPRSNLHVQRRMEERLVNAVQDPRFVISFVPNVFEQLKSLKIGQQKDVRIGTITGTGGFLEKSTGLEYASLPLNPQFPTTPTFTVPDNLDVAMAKAITSIANNIENRAKRFPEKSNLKIFDFASYHDEDQMVESIMHIEFEASRAFLELCTASIKYDVQLLNVGPTWFRQRISLPEYSSPDLGWPILSMVNLQCCVLPLNMPNLEKIEIRKTLSSSVGKTWKQNRPVWPALKTLDITVDSKVGQYVTRNFTERYMQETYTSIDTKSLFSFFFQDIRRAALTELCLNFTKEKGYVSIPKTDEMVAACPNLKKLTIVNWPGTNKSLTRLWDGLPGLEEVSLEYCKDLGNVAFVGEDVENPVFRNLKELKKLSLRGLDKMPKITDTLFSLVIRHMKLSHFTLTSEQPVGSVTSAGVICLQEGIFAGSIEKFSFQEWSLADVSSNEFKNIAAMFRSHNMI